jgi:hypothetical protein
VNKTVGLSSSKLATGEKTAFSAFTSPTLEKGHFSRTGFAVGITGFPPLNIASAQSNQAKNQR